MLADYSSTIDSIVLLESLKMAKKILPLTIAQIKAASPRDKMYRLADGQGLALWVFPNGLKSWRLAYTRKDGKKDTLVLGSLNDFTLAEARKWRDENRAKLARKEDIKSVSTIPTFKSVYEMWHKRWSLTVTSDYANLVNHNVVNNVMNYLGLMPINEIKPTHIVTALTPMENRGANESLRRVKQNISAVFDFAIARGLTEYNPAYAIKNNAFNPTSKVHFKALRPDQLIDLIRFLEFGKISTMPRLCAYFQLLTLARPGEAVRSEWAHIDFNKKLWTIPADKMKKRREHVVPLADLTIKILQDAQKISFGKRYIFVGIDLEKPMHIGTHRTAIQKGGLDTTAHGLRTLASTILNEQTKFNIDAIEMALSHAPENKVRAAYNRSEYLQERTEILIWWAKKISDCIDGVVK